MTATSVDILEEQQYGLDLPSHVVYYVGDRTTKLIKIGVTSNLRTRLNALDVIVVGQPTRLLLACEPGDFMLERDRHKQFRMIREYGEWFRRVPILMEHVNKVRQLHGVIPLGGPIPHRSIASLVRKSN